MSAIIDSLIKWSQKEPDKIFLADGKKTWSFSLFYEEAARVATFLLSSGIKNGDCVVVHLSEKSEHLISYVALLSIGAISVHIYPEREDDYVEFAARHTKAKMVLSDKFKKNIDGATVSQFPKLNDFEPTYHNDANDVAYIMFTSGTTSSPKAVLTTQDNIIFVTNTLIELAAMREGQERELILLPLGSTGGLGHFHAALTLGNYIRVLPWFYNRLDKQEIDLLLWLIEQERVSGMLLTPGLISKILNMRQDKFQTVGKSLRYLLSNVAPIRKEVIAKLLWLLPDLRFCTYYGSTEASRSVVNICRDDKERIHLTGKAAKGVEIKICGRDESGVGEIYIKGRNVMKGYLRFENDSLEEGWFKSGDLGRMDEDGFITVLGRANEAINIDGLKVIPMEIEGVLSSNEQVKDVGVCAISDETLYNQIGLAVVLTHDDIDKAEFAKEIGDIFRGLYASEKTDLYSFKIPKKVYFEKLIPRTELGKIKRNELSKLLAQNSQPFYI